MANDLYPMQPLGDLLEVLDSKRVPVKKGDRKAGPYPYYGASGIADWVDSYIFEGPHVLLAEDGENLRTRQTPIAFMADGKFWVNNHAHILRGDNELESKFFRYALLIADVDSYLSGSTRPKLTQGDMKKIPLFAPSPIVRRAVAHVLGSLDEKIELNRRANSTLEKVAQAHFKSWFTDFDPVHAKAEDRDPGLPKEIADLFPNGFEDSELGLIPAGWNVKPLSSIIELVGGGTPKTSISGYWNGDIPWFSVADAPSEYDIWVIDTEKKITQAGVDNSSTKILPKGTTIISARGTVGKCALVGNPMAMNQSCYGIRPVSGYGEICTNFVVRNQIKALQQSGHGSVFNTITRTTFDSIILPDSGKEISSAFDKLVDPYLKAILENLLESRALSSLRDTLMPKLISGELKIPDAEKVLEGIE